MSNISQFPNIEDRFDQASEWIAKMDRGLSKQEEQEMLSWMVECDENEELLLTMAEQWDKMDALSRLSDMFPHALSKHNKENQVVNHQKKNVPPIDKNTASAVRDKKEKSWAWPVAASIFLAVFSLSFYQLGFIGSDSDAQATLVYETHVGEQSSIFLPDGSQMKLNTNTLVRVLYSDKERLLDLVRGEINIDVAHEPERPLRVMAMGRVVEAVGTEFNVEITSDQDVELIVTEGLVLVSLVPTDEIIGDLSRVNGQGDDVILSESISVSAGQELLMSDSIPEAKEIKPEDINVKLSWQDGNLTFRGESMEQAMAEVARYTSIQFVFLDEHSKQVRIAGLFKAGDMNTLLSTLRENFNIKHEWIGSEKIQLSSN